jgi:hypothetical protein
LRSMRGTEVCLPPYQVCGSYKYRDRGMSIILSEDYFWNRGNAWGMCSVNILDAARMKLLHREQE